MRIFIRFQMILLLLVAIATGTSWAASGSLTSHVVPGLIVVKWRTPPGAQSLDAQAAQAVVTYHLQARGLHLPSSLHTEVYDVPTGSTVDSVLAALQKDPRVAYAQPVLRRHALTLAAPNDPAYNNLDTVVVTDPVDATWFQWNLHTIDVIDAWSVFPGTYYTAASKLALSYVPKVAIIDTGIDFTHPNFINAGGTSTDAAQGGQIDVAEAQNTLDGAVATDAADDYGHGTYVSGIAAAATNNPTGANTGIAGIGYNGQIMPLKALDATGNGTDVEIAKAITWAADHGALVISMSLGDYPYSYPEEDAVEYAWNKGCLLIAAAGNDGNTTPFYPASLPHVLAVSATAMDDTLATYSSQGHDVGVAAPGGDIDINLLEPYLVYSTLPTYMVTLNQAAQGGASENYDYEEGTSAACPHVAGLALLYAGLHHITQTTPGGNLQIWQAIQQGAADVTGNANGGWSQDVGYGRIDAYHTLLDDNPRGATVGSITGQVTLGGTPFTTARVTSKDTSGKTVVTSSNADGTYRLANLPVGIYSVTASGYGKTVTVTNISVVAGADTPGVFLALDSNSSPPTLTGFAPTSGPIGTQVTLTGSALTGATAVSFNGTTATTFTVNSDTQITATVPSGATTGTISVTTPQGAVTSSSVFTVTQPSPPVTLYSLNLSSHWYFVTASQSEDASLVAGGWANTPTGQAYQNQTDAPGLVPLYRLYYPGTGDHFYTTSLAEKDSILPYGFNDEGIACYVFPAQVSGTIPLYRAYNPTTGEHRYTGNAAEYSGLPSPWQKEGAQCYILPPPNQAAPPVPLYSLNYQSHWYFVTASQSEDNSLVAGGWANALTGHAYAGASDVAGLVPLYRLYYPGTGDHFYTTSLAEKDSILPYGFNDEGIACYVFPAQVSGTIPLYRAYNPTTGEHRYTGNAAEYSGLPSPWQKEGAQCYILP